jgi:hypothetical protein
MAASGLAPAIQRQRSKVRIRFDFCYYHIRPISSSHCLFFLFFSFFLLVMAVTSVYI